MKEGQTEPFLKAAYQLPDCCWSDIELGSRGGKALMPGSRLEGSQRVQVDRRRHRRQSVSLLGSDNSTLALAAERAVRGRERELKRSRSGCCVRAGRASRHLDELPRMRCRFQEAIEFLRSDRNSGGIHQ